jgi:hypothetical protein
MPNRFGVRSIYNQVRRGFRLRNVFDVRYWTLPEMRRTFTELIGPTSLSADSFFSFNAQTSDIDLLPLKYGLVVFCSHALRRISERMRLLVYFADSIYVKAISRFGAEEEV